jgi:carbonic anhydrase
MDLLQRVSRFRCEIFPDHQSLYRQLASDGQQPKVLMI